MQGYGSSLFDDKEHDDAYYTFRITTAATTLLNQWLMKRTSFEVHVHVVWDKLKLVTRNQLVQRVEVYNVQFYYSPEPVTDEENAF